MLGGATCTLRGRGQIWGLGKGWTVWEAEGSCRNGFL